MSVCIIGGGLAGLATAIKIKLNDQKTDVLLINKRIPESNTQIAGQRYRARTAGKGRDPEGEIVSLLASRNGGEVTEEMRTFSEIAITELGVWQDVLPDGMITDKAEWFGPQWGIANTAGMGRGKSVLKRF